MTFYKKYLKYKKKYLNLIGGLKTDKKLFYKINISDLTPEKKIDLKNKFEIEFELANRLCNFYDSIIKKMTIYNNYLNKENPDNINIDFFNNINKKIIESNNEGMISIIVYIRSLRDLYNDLIILKDTIITEVNITQIFKTYGSCIDISNTKLYFELREVRDEIFLLKFSFDDLKSKSVAHMNKKSIISIILNQINIILSIIDLEKEYDFNEIIDYYTVNYTNLLNLPNDKPSNIVFPDLLSSKPCIVWFNLLTKNSIEHIKKQKQVFYAMSMGTLRFYNKTFDYIKPPTMDRYLVSYDNQIFMFINTGIIPETNIRISEHILITKLPSNIISNIIISQPNLPLAIDLHLYGLSEFCPDYIVSYPLDIMTDIFNSFEKLGIFYNPKKELSIDGITIDAKNFVRNLKIIFPPSIQYNINHEKLFNKLKEEGYI
jgi:hypothetical protein